MKISILIIFLLSACSHVSKEVRQNNLKKTSFSHAARSFYTSLKKKNWKVALSYLGDSVILSESAYKVGKGWCSPHYRDSIIPRKKMASILVALSKAVGGSKIEHFSKNSFGVSSMGDCEHIWSIEFNSDIRIIKINIDAKDNHWNSQRVEFK